MGGGDQEPVKSLPCPFVLISLLDKCEKIHRCSHSETRRDHLIGRADGPSEMGESCITFFYQICFDFKRQMLVNNSILLQCCKMPWF